MEIFDINVSSAHSLTKSVVAVQHALADSSRPLNLRHIFGFMFRANQYFRDAASPVLKHAKQVIEIGSRFASEVATAGQVAMLYLFALPLIFVFRQNVVA